MLLNQTQATQTLFGSFPRYIGPLQSQVNSFPELLSHMVSQSGIMNSFVSVYHFLPHFIPVLDKLFLETDYKSPETAFRVGQILFEECTERYNIPTLPIWSGNRSPHILPLFIPEILKNPTEAIKKLAYKITYTSNQFYIDPYNKKYVPYIDTKVLEHRRLCRFPNTRRISPSGTPTPNHCIILDPETFPDMSLKYVQELSLSPQTDSINLNPPNKKISDIPVNEINLDDWAGTSASFSSPQSSFSPETSTIRHSSLELIINSLLKRPCNIKALESPNPPHKARCSVAAELNHNGVSETFANYFFSLLSLYDYVPSTTAYHISHVYNGNYFPSGYRAMQDIGLCSYDPDNINCRKCHKAF